MLAIVWTTPENPAHFLYASIVGGRRIAMLGRTAQGVMLCLYPTGVIGEGKNHPVASIEQGKRFLARWVAKHEAQVTRPYTPSRQPLWPVRDAC